MANPSKPKSAAGSVSPNSSPRAASVCFFVIGVVAIVAAFFWITGLATNNIEIPSSFKVNQPQVPLRRYSPTFADGVPFQDKSWTRQDPCPEDFLGKWSGRWDRVWAVQITISQLPESKQLVVFYEWEENRGGGFEQRQFATTLSKEVLQIGDSIKMTLSAADPNQAKATGNFAHQRIADLVRDITASDSSQVGGSKTP